MAVPVHTTRADPMGEGPDSDLWCQKFFAAGSVHSNRRKSFQTAGVAP